MHAEHHLAHVLVVEGFEDVADALEFVVRRNDHAGTQVGRGTLKNELGGEKEALY